MINIHRRSPLTNDLNAIEFSIDAIEFFNWCDMPEQFRPQLRSAFPQLTDEDMDFIHYGVMPGEWRGIVAEGKADKLEWWSPIGRRV